MAGMTLLLQIAVYGELQGPLCSFLSFTILSFFFLFFFSPRIFS